jgi:hypothetical protein
MNTTGLVAAFIVIVSGLIWVGTHSNDAEWTGNRNQCVDECYDDWKATNGGGIAEVEQAKQVALGRRNARRTGRKILRTMYRLSRGPWRGRHWSAACGAGNRRYRGKTDCLSGR